MNKSILIRIADRAALGLSAGGCAGLVLWVMGIHIAPVWLLIGAVMLSVLSRLKMTKAPRHADIVFHAIGIDSILIPAGERTPLHLRHPGNSPGDPTVPGSAAWKVLVARHPD